MPVLPESYMHPEDERALANLRSIPLFTQCMQAFMKFMPERIMRGMSMAQKVRLGPDQLPDIYRYLPPACEKLGIPEPEFFLEMNPQPNAYTFGDQTVFITVTSGLIEAMEDREIQAVIAHECGHIACHHVLYHSMATMLLQIGASIFGPVAAVSMPVQLGLLYWMRRSELSADRASAVVMEGADEVVNVLTRLAGGPRSITDKINIKLYIEQANEYDRLHESQWDHLLMGFQVMGQDHPLTAVRAREILQWCSGDDFTRLMRAEQDIVNTPVSGNAKKCLYCGYILQVDWVFCRQCGATVPEEPAI